MFGDLIRRLDAMGETARLQLRTSENLFRMFINEMEAKSLDFLILQAQDAMALIPEYSNAKASPLRDRLVDNLSTYKGGRPVHVRIHPNGSVDVFNEAFAGTEADLEKARYPSSLSPEQAAIFWKFGIYKPSVEGFTHPELEGKTVSYESVIEERLSAWGTGNSAGSAPFWRFIQHGNQGTGREYPSHSGVDFIESSELVIDAATREFRDTVVQIFAEDVTRAIERSYESGTPQPPTEPEILWTKTITRAGKNVQLAYTVTPQGARFTGQYREV